MSMPKPSEEMKFKTSITMMIFASLSQLMQLQSQPTLEVFLGKQVVLEPSLHFTPVLQSSGFILPSVSALPPVCSLQTGGKVSLQLWLITPTLTLIILDKWLWIYENNVCKLRIKVLIWNEHYLNIVGN